MAHHPEDAAQTERNPDYEYQILTDKAGQPYLAILKSLNPPSLTVVPAQINGLPVREIAERAFADNRRLAEVVLPEGLQIIRAEAFYNCRNLQKINFPATLLEIGTQRSLRAGRKLSGAFENCVNLSAVDIPHSVVIMAKNTFRGCVNLRSFQFPRHIIGI